MNSDRSTNKSQTQQPSQAITSSSNLASSTVLLTHITRLLMPFIIAFGLYVQINSHDSPGGGFQAGAILASAFILYALVFGIDNALSKLSFSALISLAALGIAIYLGVGATSVLAGQPFLNYTILDTEQGNGHRIGIFLVELGVGLAVFATMSLLYCCFAKENK